MDRFYTLCVGYNQMAPDAGKLFQRIYERKDDRHGSAKAKPAPKAATMMFIIVCCVYGIAWIITFICTMIATNRRFKRQQGKGGDLVTAKLKAIVLSALLAAIWPAIAMAIVKRLLSKLKRSLKKRSNNPNIIDMNP